MTALLIISAIVVALIAFAVLLVFLFGEVVQEMCDLDDDLFDRWRQDRASGDCG